MQSLRSKYFPSTGLVPDEERPCCYCICSWGAARQLLPCKPPMLRCEPSMHRWLGAEMQSSCRTKGVATNLEDRSVSLKGLHKAGSPLQCSQNCHFRSSFHFGLPFTQLRILSLPRSSPHTAHYMLPPDRPPNSSKTCSTPSPIHLSSTCCACPFCILSELRFFHRVSLTLAGLSSWFPHSQC